MAVRCVTQTPPVTSAPIRDVAKSPSSSTMNPVLCLSPTRIGPLPNAKPSSARSTATRATPREPISVAFAKRVSALVPTSLKQAAKPSSVAASNNPVCSGVRSESGISSDYDAWFLAHTFKTPGTNAEPSTPWNNSRPDVSQIRVSNWQPNFFVLYSP